MAAMIQVRRPVSEADIAAVRDLVLGFHAWHRERHLEDIDLIDRYFEPGAFQKEVDTLAVKYGPPRGSLLLATWDGEPAGCVALREISRDDCEMKRMFVWPKFHGKGVGRALGEAILAEGKRLGYGRMLLDTSVRQIEAHALYGRLGFSDTAPYYDMPDDVRAWLVFMERALI